MRVVKGEGDFLVGIISPSPWLHFVYRLMGFIGLFGSSIRASLSDTLGISVAESHVLHGIERGRAKVAEGRLRELGGGMTASRSRRCKE